MHIGIAGTVGSFTEEAAREYMRRSGGDEYDIVYLLQAAKVLDALEAGSIDTGIFAIENSNGGVVTEYLPAIAEHRFSIETTFEIPVNHMLLTLPGTERTSIHSIVSQNQALRQCRTYIKRVWPEAEVHEYVDTATAAKDLASGVLPKETAVIASRAAGNAYGLHILEENIQDLKFNFTTFIVARRMS